MILVLFVCFVFLFPNQFCWMGRKNYCFVLRVVSLQLIALPA